MNGKKQLKYGSYTYSFTPTGIGCVVEVFWSAMNALKQDPTLSIEEALEINL